MKTLRKQKPLNTSLMMALAFLALNLSCQRVPFKTGPSVSVSTEGSNTPTVWSDMWRGRQMVNSGLYFSTGSQQGLQRTLELPISYQQVSFFQWPEDGILSNNTSEIFLLAEGLIELGLMSPPNSLSYRILTETGHHLISRFYDKPHHYTNYSSLRTPYMQVALGFTELDNDLLLFHQIRDQVIQALPQVRATLSQIQLPRLIIVPDASFYELDPYFDHIRTGFLRPAYNALSQNSSLPSLLISNIQGLLDASSYILDQLQHDLETAFHQQDTSWTNNEDILESLLQRVEGAYHTFFDRLAYHLTSTESLTQAKILISNHLQARYEQRQSLVESIVGLPFGTPFLSLMERGARVISRKSMKGAERFSATRDHFISEALQTEWSFEKLYQAGRAMQLIYGVHDLYQISRLANFIADATDSDVLATQIFLEQAQAINAFLPQIPRVVTDVLIAHLSDYNDANHLYDNLHSFASDQIQDLVFKEKPRLPGIEFSNARLVQSYGQQVRFTSAQDYDEMTMTNGITFGTAISALMARLRSERHLESTSFDEDTSNQLLFSLMNKSLRMMGYKTLVKSDQGVYTPRYPRSFLWSIPRETGDTLLDNSIMSNEFLFGQNGLSVDDTEHLSLPCSSTSDEGQALSAYLAIPDQVFLNPGPFDIDLTLPRGEGMSFTVASQAELIRGASRVLREIRPNQDVLFPLDIGLSGYDEIFIVPSVFNLHLVIARLFLEGVRKQNVVFYNLQEEPHQVVGQTWPDGIASVHDILDGQQVLDIKTVDMARLIRAIEDLIKVAQGLDLESLEEREDLSCMDKEVYRQFKESVLDFGHLSLALGEFMMSRLQREDGHFIEHLFIESPIPAPTRHFLEAQVQAVSALTDLYVRVKREDLKVSAVKGFNYITGNLFDPEDGYVVMEGSMERPNLRVTTDLLRLLFQIESLLEGSDIYLRARLRTLRQRWVSNFAEEIAFLRNIL